MLLDHTCGRASRSNCENLYLEELQSPRTVHCRCSCVGRLSYQLGKDKLPSVLCDGINGVTWVLGQRCRLVAVWKRRAAFSIWAEFMVLVRVRVTVAVRVIRAFSIWTDFPVVKWTPERNVIAHTHATSSREHAWESMTSSRENFRPKNAQRTLRSRAGCIHRHPPSSHTER
jgi:hypothetical protein